jgi:hypothetical protein
MLSALNHIRSRIWHPAMPDSNKIHTLLRVVMTASCTRGPYLRSVLFSYSMEVMMSALSHGRELSETYPVPNALALQE